MPRFPSPTLNIKKLHVSLTVNTLDISLIEAIKVDSIPFRFKAGGSMAPMPEAHEHRSTTKVSHKPFKSKHATKSAIKDALKGAGLNAHYPNPRFH